MRCRAAYKKGRPRPEVSRPIGARRLHNSGYIDIKTGKGWMREHRHIMELYLKRPLMLCEVVHHKDGDKKNNSIENLEIMNSGAHTRLHHTGLKRSLATRMKISLKAKERYANELQQGFIDRTAFAGS